MKTLLCCVKVIFAVIMCAAGVQFLIMAGWGLDPLTAFESALANKLDITLGRASLLFEGMTFVFFFFVNRKLLKFGSFAFCFGIGPCIDFWGSVFSGIGEGGSLQERFLFLIIGSVLIIVGIAYYVPLNFGLQSLDMYSVSVAGALHKKYGVGLTITYSVMVAGAMALGVYPGITTLIAMTAYGYCIDKVRKFFEGGKL